MTGAKREYVADKFNSRGIHYCITREGEVFQVWKLCENYCRHVKGGIAKSWRLVAGKLNEADAFTIYNRRTK